MMFTFSNFTFLAGPRVSEDLYCHSRSSKVHQEPKEKLKSKRIEKSMLWNRIMISKVIFKVTE